MRVTLKSQNYWTALLGALFFLLIGAGATLALLLTDNSSTRDEAALPFVMTSAVAVVILIGGFIINGIKEQAERTAIARVTAHTWVKWPQYESDASWRAFAEQTYVTEMAQRRYPWLGFIVIVLLLTGAAGFTFYLANADGANLLLVALPLGAFFSFVLLLMLGSVAAARRKINATYRSYNGLANVYYQQGSPATLNFQFSIAVRYGFYTELLTVNVPRGQEAAADNLAHRFFDEGIVRR